MLLTMFVLTFLVAIPNALAPVTHLEGIAFLSTGRTQQFGWGPTFHCGFGTTILPPRRFAERHGPDLLGSCRCTVLVTGRGCHGCERVAVTHGRLICRRTDEQTNRRTDAAKNSKRPNANEPPAVGPTGEGASSDEGPVGRPLLLWFRIPDFRTRPHSLFDIIERPRRARRELNCQVYPNSLLGTTHNNTYICVSHAATRIARDVCHLPLTRTLDSYSTRHQRWESPR